jgi:hypothetical protein
MYSYNKVNVGIVATVSYASLSQKKCDDLQKICFTSIQENSIYKKQGPSPISLVRATKIFSKSKTLKTKFDLSLAIGDNPIHPF